MEVVHKISGTAAVIDLENIDTDQIIPAEHLKITDKSGLGQHLFAHWRFDESGVERKDFVLNQNATRSANILIAGDNFACGSSREHAPWALLDFGFRVVISSRIADIFTSNAIKNGLLPVVVDKQSLSYLFEFNGQSIDVDIESETIRAGDKILTFKLEPFSRYCFLNGMDQLDFLLSHEEQITAYESQRVRTVI